MASVSSPEDDPVRQLKRIQDRHGHAASSNPPTLPTSEAIATAQQSLPRRSSASYLSGQDPEAVVEHIASDIVPALTGQNASSRYFGLVTGGVLPIAEWADNVVSRMDQNVSLHVPDQSVSTSVEDAALSMLSDVLQLGDNFKGRVLTTGATSSNVLGLACGREAVVNMRLQKKNSNSNNTVGELGLLKACFKAGLSDIQVLTSGGHSSLSKAASVVGLGRTSVKQLSVRAEEPWLLDIDAVESCLKQQQQHGGTASIICISAGEVNTGRFALRGEEDMRRLRRLADEHAAWIHVDGAFGIFARALDDTEEFALLKKHVAGIELADSITVDGHKLLNVPYDCGMFYTHSQSILTSVFVNPNASYLSSTASPSSAAIPSPLNVGLENSRRFRALPVYAVLLSEGRPGIASMIARTVRLARGVAAYLRNSPHYILLPASNGKEASLVDVEEMFMIVLFRTTSRDLDDALMSKINETRQMYVSGTTWDGQTAVRIAVSNWKVDVQRDLAVVTRILDCVGEGKTFSLADSV